MYYSENIGIILRLFREEHTERNKEYLSNFDSALKSKVIAELLLNSNIATPELNRENVAQLLSGKLAWPKDNGEEYKRDLNVELSTLEKLGAVTFYANYCQVHVRNLPDIGEVDESCKPLFEAVALLRNIIFGWESFVKPYFKIDKKKAESILSDRSLPLITTEFKEENDFYHLDALECNFDNLIAEYLWEGLIKQLALEEEEEGSCSVNLNEQQLILMKKWLLICRVYSDNYLSQINFSFVNRFHKKVYLEFFEYLIDSDEQLKQPKLVLENKWLCSSDIRGMFLDIRSEHRVQINFTSPDSATKNSYKETINPKKLVDVERSFFSNGNPAPSSNLAFCDELYRCRFNEGDSGNFYSSPLGEIINSDIYVSSSSINSYGRLDRLFEKSQRSHELRFMMLSEGLHYSEVKYLLYLLTKKETATIALYLFGNSSLNYRLNLTHKELESYHLEYFPVVCDEFLEVYFKNYFKNGGVDKDVESADDIVELLILMAKGAIRDSYAGESNSRKDCLDILKSKFNLEQISAISDCLLSSIENDKSGAERCLSVWKFYLLFWLLEVAQDLNLSEGEEISNKTQVLITKLYCECFERNVDNKDHRINAYKLFEFLPWWRIDSKYISDYLQLIRKPAQWSLKLSSSDELGYQNKNIVRSYFQLLIGLHSDSRNDSCNSKIILKILSLLECCGFLDGEVDFHGIFDFESQYDYLLWQQFTLFVEYLNDEEFDRVISVLRDEAPLNKILELYINLKRESRKFQLLQYVKDASSDNALENLNIIALEKSLDFACRVGQVDTAKIMLDKGLSLLSDSNSYINKRLSTANISKLKDDWSAYEFKVGLLLISKDESLSDENKLDSLRKAVLPFEGEDTHHVRQELTTNCERFQKQITALILYSTNPEAAYKYFDGLYRELRTHDIAGNRFASKLKYLDSNLETTKADYKKALSEWLESASGVNAHEIDFNIISNWLYCLNKINDFRGVDVLWNRLSKSQHHNVSIVTSYCSSLKQRGQHYVAQSIYEKLKNYHNVTSLGEEADQQLLELEALIVKDIEPKHASALTNMLANQPRSVDELRQRYSEIKSQKLADIVTIIEGANSTIDSFLYEQLSSIIGEIQLRKSNLNKTTDKSGSQDSHRIINEDPINDWVTSLFDHRLSYIGLSCRDQKRGGRSPNSQNPGEIDFFLCGNNNERIAIMEAFRLFSNDTTVIESHLNKIAGYDQECLSPVFIIAYCDVSDFIGLCDKYYDDTKVRDYKGFEKSTTKGDNIQTVQSSQTLNFYKEVRYRAHKPIVIYHLMINLRF
ncbi:hypothetical protein MHM98_03440 [Psychrobium sp. MM17-31]|uniref:hypothetical protein n=1 Tax=Psychrobium sp. MM17-31 TaxID=2917758 RepID=UPI001EF42CD3|nr:hypothetical protein [Psychrobium sp. MM17-31]MCG7530413.1 hypothetical protein [Psychrobium sp. MM17-31]